MSVGPNDVSFVPVARAVVEALARPSPRPRDQAGVAAVSGVSVARAAPLPPLSASLPKPALPPVDGRPQAARIAIVGMRESRAMAALAADLAARLAEVPPVEAESIRSRLREVVEIGSARDTAGPLAVLYAAARRDPSQPLARVLDSGLAPESRDFREALAGAIEALRGLDERFAARDAALAGPPQGKPASAATTALDLTV